MKNVTFTDESKLHFTEIRCTFPVEYDGSEMDWTVGTIYRDVFNGASKCKLELGEWRVTTKDVELILNKMRELEKLPV